MDPSELELLTGMGNCYAACHEDFESTVGMVAGARGRDPTEVRATLEGMRQRYGADPNYQKLRRRMPAEFPL